MGKKSAASRDMAEVGRKGGIQRAANLSPDRRAAIAGEGGSKGGKAGGAARAAALTPEERRDIASKAARARWAGKRGAKGN